MSFPCTKCGACCRRAWAFQGALPTKEDGSCLHLTKDNECAIYEDRPLLCRIDEMHETLMPDMAIEDFYEVNAGFCNQAIKEDGMASEFLVQIGV